MLSPPWSTFPKASCTNPVGRLQLSSALEGLEGPLGLGVLSMYIKSLNKPPIFVQILDKTKLKTEVRTQMLQNKCYKHHQYTQSSYYRLVLETKFWRSQRNVSKLALQQTTHGIANNTPNTAERPLTPPTSAETNQATKPPKNFLSNTLKPSEKHKKRNSKARKNHTKPYKAIAENTPLTAERKPRRLFSSSSMVWSPFLLMIWPAIAAWKNDKDPKRKPSSPGLDIYDAFMHIIGIQHIEFSLTHWFYIFLVIELHVWIYWHMQS